MIAGSARTRPEHPTAAGLLAAVFLCAGCYSYRPVLVHVRDRATREPVAGATVLADAPDPRHPLRLADLLDPFSPAGGRAVTGHDGAAEVRCVAGRPVQFCVAAPGYVPQGLYFDEAPAATDWLCPDPDAPDPLRSLEVRLGP